MTKGDETIVPATQHLRGGAPLEGKIGRPFILASLDQGPEELHNADIEAFDKGGRKLRAKVVVDAGHRLGKVDRKIYGHFVEHLGRCIYNSVWVGERSPIPNVQGYRKDVLEAVKRLKPPIVRWPGGTSPPATTGETV